MKTYYAQPGKVPPTFMDTTKDMASWVSDCTCHVCNNRRKASEVTTNKLAFAKFHEIFPEDVDELDDETYYLLPPTIYAYVFKTRTWGKEDICKRQAQLLTLFIEKLKVDNFSPPVFDQTIIDKLVMDDARLTMIKSLAASHIRQNKKGELLKQPAWQADFVEGKGKGHIFLLHGKPGVGKTYTAGKLVIS
jgi:hypothetical protein